jgi:hypothetical protein
MRGAGQPAIECLQDYTQAAPPRVRVAAWEPSLAAQLMQALGHP